jgi:glucan phosphoethanolaminetransferase (alkaline phosphatase superfamily)
MPRGDFTSRFDARRMAIYALKIVVVLAFVLWTNTGFASRIHLLLGQGRWGTLIGFVGVWGLSLAALLVVAFQSNRWLRISWAAVIGFSSAVGFAYHRASGSDFGVLDALSLWNAKHEATRAAEFYSSDLYWLGIALVAGFIVFVVPPAPRALVAKRWITRAAWLPALPIVVIVAIIVSKEGGGSEALPTQFEPLSVGLVLGSKLASHPMPDRRDVSLAWQGPFAPGSSTAGGGNPNSTPIRRIVVVIDESVRADYIDWTPGNPYTPQIAALKDKIVDFGPAASGGNCSHYSNAILRFAAKQDGLGRELLSNPTLWQYAKHAGFRTVYIDGQAGFNRNPGKLQNFMTAGEVRDIDHVYALDEAIPPPALDDKLLDIVLNELKSDGPVLIYANKNGAHFPYDQGYPKSERIFAPTMSEAATDTSVSRVNSFRNVVRWSVDRIMHRMIEQSALQDTVIIYTSDHGQAFNPDHFTHCSVENPDPREGFVPLFAATANDALRARLTEAAAVSHGHGSHFSIAPTVLTLLGYSQDAVAKTYGASLLTKSSRLPEFTTGDIFGLFAAEPRRHLIDLGQDYREPGPMVSMH